MSSQSAGSLVTVFSTPNALEAELVKSMLAGEGIPSFVEDANGPFPGISAAPCHLMVASEFEVSARELISEHERERIMRVDEEFEEEVEEEHEAEDEQRFRDNPK